MKLTLLALLLIPAALVADDNTQKSSSHPAAKTPTTKVAEQNPPQQPPPGAKQIEPFAYRWTDPQGKRWIYRQTPFGWVHLEDKPAPPMVSSAPPMTAVEDGDVVHFEKSTPLGKSRWTKSKSDLTEDEKAALERQKEQKTETTKKEKEQ